MHSGVIAGSVGCVDAPYLWTSRLPVHLRVVWVFELLEHVALGPEAGQDLLRLRDRALHAFVSGSQDEGRTWGLQFPLEL